jgi:hypothetical protein
MNPLAPVTRVSPRCLLKAPYHLRYLLPAHEGMRLKCSPLCASPKPQTPAHREAADSPLDMSPPAMSAPLESTNGDAGRQGGGSGLGRLRRCPGGESQEGPNQGQEAHGRAATTSRSCRAA